MIAVPAPIPVATPAALTDTTATLLVLHEPPAADSLNAIELPTQIVEMPEIAPGVGGAVTVNAVVEVPVPQAVVTV